MWKESREKIMLQHDDTFVQQSITKSKELKEQKKKKKTFTQPRNTFRCCHTDSCSSFLTEGQFIYFYLFPATKIFETIPLM